MTDETKPTTGNQDKGKAQSFLGSLWPHYPLLQSKHGLEPISKVFKDNIRSASVVAFVSLPLSASLGVASGVSPIVGIATSIWAGLVMSTLGSSDYNIVGCSGAISGMMNAAIVKWSPAIVPYLALFSACFCFLFRVFRLDKYLFHMPSSVFQGFSIAVAIIIGFNQLNFAFRLSPAELGYKKKEHFYENIIDSFKSIPDQAHAWTIVLTAINVLFLLVAMAKKPLIPWIPVSAVITMLFGFLADDVKGPGVFKDLEIYNLYNYNGNEWFKREVRFDITSWGDLSDFCKLKEPSTRMLGGGGGGVATGWCSSELSAGPVITAAGLIAFVAVLETVLAAKIASMRVDRPFDPPQEMAALTVCHTVQGLMGVMPTTGLFLRCNVNVSQGATHRMSQFVNSLIMLVVILAIAPQFSYLPQFGVAGILISASIRMVPYPYLYDLWKNDKERFLGVSTSLLVLIVTVALCVMIDPAVGLILGIFFAFMINAAKSLANEYISYEILETGSQSRPTTDILKIQARVIYNSPLSYVAGEKLQDALKNLPNEICHMINKYEDRRGDLKKGLICNSKLEHMHDHTTASKVLVEGQRASKSAQERTATDFLVRQTITNEILAKYNIQLTIIVDLSSCHYCDLDGLTFLEKGCKLMEQNIEKQGPKSVKTEGGDSDATPDVNDGGMQLKKLVIEGVQHSEQIMTYIAATPYLLEKVPKSVSSKLITAFMTDSMALGDRSPKASKEVAAGIVSSISNSIPFKSKSKEFAEGAAVPSPITNEAKAELGTMQEGVFVKEEVVAGIPIEKESPDETEDTQI